VPHSDQRPFVLLPKVLANAPRKLAAVGKEFFWLDVIFPLQPKRTSRP
jgi:hypothetical protein